MDNLSQAEQEALDVLRRNGGVILVSAVPDKTERGILGEVIPGIAIYRKLEKKGLVYFTEVISKVRLEKDKKKAQKAMTRKTPPERKKQIATPFQAIDEL